LLYVPRSSGWEDRFRVLADAPREMRLEHAAAVTFYTIDV